MVALSEKILNSLLHVQNNRKDFKSVQSFSQLVNERVRLLNKLRVQDQNAYLQIVRDY